MLAVNINRVKYSGTESDLEEGDLLRDWRREDQFEITTTDESGIGLHHDGTEFYIPHSLFAPWYGSRIHSVTAAMTTEPANWTNSDDPEE
jgi:hypothetical protein